MAALILPAGRWTGKRGFHFALLLLALTAAAVQFLVGHK